MDTFFIILLVAAFVAVAYYFGKKKNDKLIAGHRIVARPYDWYKNGELFTLTGADFARVAQGVTGADLSGTGASASKSDEKQVIGFKSGTWQAELYKKENDGDKDVYYFHFVKWDSRNGTPYGLSGMNILQTAVEKVFLAIDPGTQVKAVPIHIKSRPSFF